MHTVIIRKYSTFFDPVTGVQFNPVLDKAAGVYIGVAHVDDSQVAHFRANSAYEVIDDETYGALAGGLPAAGSSTISNKIRADVAALADEVMKSGPLHPK